MKTIKRVAAFVLAISFCFVLMLSPGVHAAGTPLLGGQQFGALIASGLLSLNIIANTALQSQPVQKLWEWCSAPTAEDRINYLFPHTADIISDYMNAATIKVRQGVTTIDGVEYDELWISPGTFTDGLKTDIFDFKTKWEILSGNVGTLATGVGYCQGVPMYRVNGVITSPKFRMTGGPDWTSYTVGDSTLRLRFQENNKPVGNWIVNGSSYTQSGGWSVGTYTPQEVDAYLNGSGHMIIPYKMYTGGSNTIDISGGHYVSDPFQFDYVSGIVPADESEIPSDYGLSLQIPHDKLQTFYSTYPQYNIDNSVINIQQDEVDIDELTQAIFDLIDSMDDMRAEWTEEEEPPAPVDPIENIDQNVSDITQYQENMQSNIDHMHQDVESIHETQLQQQEVQEQMQQTQEQIQEDTSSIDSTLKDVTATPGQSDLPSFKFDLRELFPFCIPFDIYRLLSSFDATPEAPHVRLPIVIQSIGFSYTLDLDFRSWDPVAQAMRTAELIVYAIGLAWATGKVIKW